LRVQPADLLGERVLLGSDRQGAFGWCRDDGDHQSGQYHNDDNGISGVDPDYKRRNDRGAADNDHDNRSRDVHDGSAHDHDNDQATNDNHHDRAHNDDDDRAHDHDDDLHDHHDDDDNDNNDDGATDDDDNDNDRTLVLSSLADMLGPVVPALAGPASIGQHHLHLPGLLHSDDAAPVAEASRIS
jgi:hypothetical protein